MYNTNMMAPTKLLITDSFLMPNMMWLPVQFWNPENGKFIVFIVYKSTISGMLAIFFNSWVSLFTLCYVYSYTIFFLRGHLYFTEAAQLYGKQYKILVI